MSAIQYRYFAYFTTVLMPRRYFEHIPPQAHARLRSQHAGILGTDTRNFHAFSQSFIHFPFTCLNIFNNLQLAFIHEQQRQRELCCCLRCMIPTDQHQHLQRNQHATCAYIGWAIKYRWHAVKLHDVQRKEQKQEHTLPHQWKATRTITNGLLHI